LGKRFRATTRSSSSITTMTLLLECKSIPQYFISASRAKAVSACTAHANPGASSAPEAG